MVRERPGAVYLASVLATHAQKGLPAFGIYGQDVQEATDSSIPRDVKEKASPLWPCCCSSCKQCVENPICRLVLSVWESEGRLSIPLYIEEYLGMRVESIDEVEIIRRMTKGIYDEEEFKKDTCNGQS